MEDIILKLEGVTKVFPGVTALDNVSISVRRGEVHAIVGENGAGKTTLMRILYGLVAPDGGVIELDVVVGEDRSVALRDATHGDAWRHSRRRWSAHPDRSVRACAGRPAGSVI